MKGTPYSDTLELAYATGDLYGMDPADVAAMARSAVAEGAAGESDPEAAFQCVMNDYMDHVTDAILADSDEYFSNEEAETHAPARRGMMRNLGITEDELSAAEEAHASGNRGPMLKLRTAYMESM